MAIGSRRLAIALGASLGERRPTLELTVRKLAAHPGLRLLRTSRWVRSPPLAGGSARNWFLNGVALFEIQVDPVEVLDLCIALEAAAGRRRVRHWGDRPLDLDLLLLEGATVNTERLVLPHRAMASRPFVLGPLLEVWPDARHPTTGVPYGSLPWPAGPAPYPVGILPRSPPLRYL